MVGFHSASHRSAAEVTEANLRREVVEPVQRITELAGRAPRVGAYRGGARFDDQRVANRRLRELGVRYLVSNWSVEVVPDAASLGHGDHERRGTGGGG